MRKAIRISVLLILVSYSLFAQYNKRYIYYMGQNAIVSKNYYQAINLLTTLIDTDTLSQEAYFLRAIAKYNLNDIMGAENDFTNAIRVNPVYVDAYQYRAITRSIMGNYNDALGDFQKALTIRPDFYDTYYSRGVTLLLNQQFKDAIKDFDSYIRHSPKSEDAIINRGTAYLMLQDTVNALENYNEAIKVAPRYSDGYVRRGNLFMLKGEYGKATDDLDNAIKYDNKNLGAYFNRALVYAYSDQPLKSIDDFSTILAKDSTNALTYFNRALLRSQIGDYNKALEDYNMVARYSPSNVLVYYNRGGLNMKLGDLENAFADFSKAITLYPDFANAYLNRSQTRLLLGDKRGAESDYATANKKIKEYKSRYKNNDSDDKFTQYADTSKVLNTLLSFDSKDFKTDDNVKDKNIDIKLLPLYRFAISTDSLQKRELYENKDVLSFVKEIGIPRLRITNRKENITADTSYYRRSSREMPKSWVSDFIIGVREYSLRQYTNSINEYNRAIADNSYNSFLYFNRSSVKCEMIEFISSLEGKEQTLVIGKDRTKSLERAKRTFDFKEPLEDIDYAISINPYVSYFYYNKGNLLCLSGEMPQAIDAYNKAIEIDHQFAEAYYNRGLIQLYLKDSRKGYLDISRAGELGLTEAYTKLRELQDSK
ncbi:MAG: tetratricopeptide repeat protein [Rikenellaceae bacterium]